MIAGKVPTEQELIEALREKGYECSNIKTATSTLWRHKSTKRILQVPFPYQGMYPKWMCDDLIKKVGDLSIWEWGPRKDH